MRHPVIVYSLDDIRGRIVFNTLKVSDIESRLSATHYEAQEAIDAHGTHLIIFDAKRNFSNELRAIKRLSIDYPDTTIIVLCSPSDVTVLENLGLENVRYVPDPLDPELILTMVRANLDSAFSIRGFLRITCSTLALLTRICYRTLPIAITLLIGLMGGYVYWCISTLPEIEILENYTPYEASKLYAYDNTLLTEFYKERRTFISNEMIPKYVKDAFIAVEDNRYYRHNGIDVLRIISALITDIKERAFLQGGSTITQQLAKMIFLKPEKTITRKIKEIALSLQIESKYSKDEILGLYLNKAYFGSRAYGIEAASQAYFGKSVTNLTIPEAALLASLLKAPTKYSPFRDMKRSLRRRNYVLQRMLKTGFIDEKEYYDSLRYPLPVKYNGRKYKAPYFVDYCKKILEKKYGERLYTSGLKIYTTLDYRMQQMAESAIETGIEDLKKRIEGEVQAALLAIDLRTGDIKAMVGGTNFWNSQFNRVTQAMRQPGSAFKPIVFLTALNLGFKPNHKVEDKMITYSLRNGKYTWTPRNHDDVYYSTVSMRTALARSLNSATVRMAKIVGLGNVIKTAKKIGIKSRIYPYYSSALGASELTLMELVYAYAAFSHGKRMEPISIKKVIDKENLTIIDPSGVQERVIPKRSLANIRHMLRAVMVEGTGFKANVLGKKVYGKTGTSNDYSDAWFIGFDEDIAVGVWVGRDNGAPIGEDKTGSNVALPIWIDYMKRI